MIPLAGAPLLPTPPPARAPPALPPAPPPTFSRTERLAELDRVACGCIGEEGMEGGGVRRGTAEDGDGGLAGAATRPLLAVVHDDDDDDDDVDAGVDFGDADRWPAPAAVVLEDAAKKRVGIAADAAIDTLPPMLLPPSEWNEDRGATVTGPVRVNVTALRVDRLIITKRKRQTNDGGQNFFSPDDLRQKHASRRKQTGRAPAEISFFPLTCLDREVGKKCGRAFLKTRTSFPFAPCSERPGRKRTLRQGPFSRYFYLPLPFLPCCYPFCSSSPFSVS